MLKIHNTLSRKKEDFKPLQKEVSFYQCGPTVYWVQHIGNLRAMVLADLMVRSLEYLGYKVKFVRNYTDVGHLISDSDEGEDKMEKASKKENLSPDEIAGKYIGIFENDLKDLNVKEPWKKPRATGYIKEMQEMVQVLLDKGFAYVTDLAIYFDVSKVKDYTKLSGQDLSKNLAQAGKGEVSDSGKKNPADFALWFFKTGVHKDALQTWKSKFNGGEKQGFPGWHLECSVMAKSLLGNTLDLHLGGVEHIPVHHTNEIAQSESANGVEFVRYWLHNEHLLVDNKKMSKSDGTSFCLEDIKKKGFDPLVLRYLFLQAHYRSKQNFTWKALESAKISLGLMRGRVSGYAGKKGKVDEKFKVKFIQALEDDFNIPQALAVAWDLLKSGLSNADKLSAILDFDKVLGLGLNDIKKQEISSEIKDLAEKRLLARKEKNWKESDRLREEIEKMGFVVEDSKEGYDLKKK